MNIGVDFDGCILDSERIFDFYMEYENWFKAGRIKDSSRLYETSEDGYDWDSVKEREDYITRCMLYGTKKAHFIFGCDIILNKLKDEGHKIFLVTSRGQHNGKYEISSVEEKLKEFNFQFEKKLYGKGRNKGELCKENNIDVLIDDLPQNCYNAVTSGIKSIFFSSPRIKNIDCLEENIRKKIICTDNWMDVYFVIQEINSNKLVAK